MFFIAVTWFPFETVYSLTYNKMKKTANGFFRKGDSLMIPFRQSDKPLVTDAEMEQIYDKFYMYFIAISKDCSISGYEPDPLFMGLAKSTDPTDPNGFTRFEDPIMRPDDADCRPYENKTLYKSFMFLDEALTTGYKYVNAYNAKNEDHTDAFIWPSPTMAKIGSDTAIPPSSTW